VNTAIIVAAGAGTRFGGETPKQFVPILGKAIIRHTLERFEECPDVDAIVVVLAESEISGFRVTYGSGLTKLKSVVAGGATRAESVRNGLDAIDESTRIVAVHDGARPLVTPDEISATIELAKQVGAVCLVGTVADTIKSIRGGEIAGTLDREKLRRAFTPQAFKVEILRRAFGSEELTGAVTDECYLVEKLGHPIAFVEGSSRNIKITVPEDILFAEAVLRASGTQQDLAP
jgi:2-C-methyl-D-erythritol 4-phosphate cytidylyltransferase